MQSQPTSPSQHAFTTREQPLKSKTNRKTWAIAGAIGCVLVLTLIAVMVVSVFGMIKSSGAYQTSRQYFISSPIVTADLGTPIEDGFIPRGSLRVVGAGGHADLTFSLRGPKGKGSAHVIANRDATGWSIERAEWSFGAG